MNLDKLWIHSVIQLMDEELPEEYRKRILERCGRGCAFGSGMVEQLQQANLTGLSPEEVFTSLKHPCFFGERILMEEGSFLTICPECYCPFVNDNLQAIPESYCDCTMGWTKQVFETALGRPVEVEVEQSIIRGADHCRIRTTWK